MKIFRLVSTGGHDFAEASRLGAWSDNRRVEPIILQWEPGSDLLGDFTPTGFDSDLVASDRAVKALEKGSVRGFRLGQVEFEEHPKSKRLPKRKPRVKLPYSGPRLFEVIPTTEVEFVASRSSVEFSDTTGKRVAGVEGIEHISSSWDASAKQVRINRVQRIAGKGIFVRENDLGDSGIFKVRGFGWIFCTEGTKALIEREGLTNIAFHEVGETC